MDWVGFAWFGGRFNFGRVWGQICLNYSEDKIKGAGNLTLRKAVDTPPFANYLVLSSKFV